MDIFRCLQPRNNFHEILSTTNDYSQALAHLSISYGYPSLLRHLVEWGIDLAISDINGLTALHCAFMKGDLDSVRILRRWGASETVTDNWVELLRTCSQKDAVRPLTLTPRSLLGWTLKRAWKKMILIEQVVLEE